MQGQVGILLGIILILILLLFLGQEIFRPTRTGALTYSNDLISIEDIIVSNPKPMPGEIIDVKVTLRNKGPKPLGPEFLLFDYQDLKLSSLGYLKEGSKKICEVDNSKGYGKCEIDFLKPFELSDVFVEFKVPPKNELPLVQEGKKEYKIIRYKISYYQNGSKEIFIPITPNINKVPSLRYSESAGEFGPVQIQIDVPPSSGTINTGGKEIEVRYGVAGRPLTFSFRFVNIGMQGKFSEFKIKSLTLTYPTDVFNNPWCRGGTDRGGKIVFSRIDSNSPIECRFEVKDSISEEKMTDLKFEYEYVYSFYDQLMIEIQPEITSI